MKYLHLMNQPIYLIILKYDILTLLDTDNYQLVKLHCDYTVTF